MVVVALISSYKEGTLIQGAIRTALPAVDRVIVFEGPAGPELDADVPATELGQYVDQVDYERGRWRSDARKRTDMLAYAKQAYGGRSLWVLWLDADELLVNGEWLRDWLQYLAWQDELDPEQPLNARCPLKLIELDGSISVSLVKLVRGDLVRSYTLSIANLTDLDGRPAAAGNFHDHIQRWLQADPGRREKFEQGYLYLPPGLPGPLDPYLVHRSMLRHPQRAGLRLNEQEAGLLAAEHRDHRAAAGNGHAQPGAAAASPGGADQDQPADHGQS